MSLVRKFFYKKPPDGFLEICENVYVFECCFTADIWEEEDYRVYLRTLRGQLREHYPDASILVFNFGDGDCNRKTNNVFAEYDMTIMSYPRHYEGCPLLSVEVIHHFLKSSESWLAVSHQNVIIMHCERGGWPVLAFMLAAFLLYRKYYTAELKTLDMLYKQAPREILHLLSPMNPITSQLRYLQYVSRRNVASQWPPLDRALTLDCVMMRMIPNFDGNGGCRPIFRIFGQDPLLVSDRTPKELFSTPRKSKIVRHYKQGECQIVKIDINCKIQGDVVLECSSLYDDLEQEEMMFRVMFNTAFIRSNILMLNRDEIDILWDAKDRFPKEFRTEVLFSEMDAAESMAPLDLSCFEEKEGLPEEAFAKVQEIFNTVDWLVTKADAARDVIHQITASPPRKEAANLLHDLHPDKQLTRIEELTQSISSPRQQLPPEKQSAPPPPLSSQAPPPSEGGKSSTVQTSAIQTLATGTVPKSSLSHLLPSHLKTQLLEKHSETNPTSLPLSPHPPNFHTRDPTDWLRSPPSPSSTTKARLSPPPPTLPASTALSSPPVSPKDLSFPPLTDHLVTKTKPPPPSSQLPTPPPPPPPPPSAPSSLSPTPSIPQSPSPPPSSQLREESTSVRTSAPLGPPTPPRITTQEESSVSGAGAGAGAGAGPPPPPQPVPSTDNVPLPPPPSGNSSFSPPPPPPPSGNNNMSSPPPPPPPSGNNSVSPPPPPPPSGSNSLSPPPPPVPSSGGVPPPPPPGGNSSLAPPPGTKGRGGLSRTISKNNKTNKMKPLHWLKITRAVQGSLWFEAQKTGAKAPEIDISELETLFSAAAPNSGRRGPTKKSNSRSSLGSKSERVQLIDLRRAYNCEIMLSKVKVPLSELMASVLTLENSALDEDQVENLIKFCPTKEEMEMLKNYKGEKDKLGKCEQFFLELMQVPRTESKLRVFLFKIQFATQVSDLRNSLNVVNSTIDQVRSSNKLKKVMQTILQLGNALNQGTARGSAVGFRLDSLLKLTETRARNNKMTLMHYLCKILADKLPDVLDFSKDLASLEPSSKVQLKFLAEEMQSISKGLEKVVQELSISENDGPVSETFRKALKEFLSHAEGEVRCLASLYSGVGRNVDSLIIYFGEDPARCPFEQVVSTLLNFVRMFNKCHEENCKQIELEKKKAAKEEAGNEKTNQVPSLKKAAQ